MMNVLQSVSPAISKQQGLIPIDSICEWNMFQIANEIIVMIR